MVSMLDVDPDIPSLLPHTCSAQKLTMAWISLSQWEDKKAIKASPTTGHIALSPGHRALSPGHHALSSPGTLLHRAMGSVIPAFSSFSP